MSKQRKRNQTMSFELLPDEIFLDLFDYFDGTDLFDIFYGLNSRFNWLLYKHYRRFRFNFHSIAKREFDIICQQHLPLINDQVISLCLSDDETPQQLDLFFTYIPSLEKLTNLQALSLSNIVTYDTLMKIIDQCSHLHHFQYLKINLSHLLESQTDYQSIINKIWTLPHLIYGDFNVTLSALLNGFIPTNRSTSLKRLSLSGYAIKLNHINDLFEYTPRLKHLSIDLRDSDNNYTPRLLPTLINLNIRNHINNIAKIGSLLQNTPNLHCLNVSLGYNTIDGYQLEQIISKYLPKLKIFQLKLMITLDTNQNRDERMNEIMKPFRSSFWIDEHQWFIRCFACQKTIYLYTPSQPLLYSNNTFPNKFLSTDPNDNLQKFANDITQILNQKYFDSSIPTNIRLINIEQLHIEFPITDKFWSIIPHLNRLQTLKVYIMMNTPQSDLQNLLNFISHPYKLIIYDKEFESWTTPKPLQPFQIQLLRCTNNLIHHLDICDFGLVATEDIALALARSSLLNQCEILSIQVKAPEHILTFVNNMKKLHTLNVTCPWLRYHYRSTLRGANYQSYHENFNVDETIQWLKERLSTNCLVAKNQELNTQIQIWLA